MFCYLYWQTLLPVWGMPHFLHLLNEESFLDQISLSLISLFVTSLTPLQLVCSGMNCPSVLRRSERSIRFLGRCLTARLRSQTWSVLIREGLIHLAGATHRGLVDRQFIKGPTHIAGNKLNLLLFNFSEVIDHVSTTSPSQNDFPF